jgi:hypothetical protein
VLALSRQFLYIWKSRSSHRPAATKQFVLANSASLGTQGPGIFNATAS